MKVFLPRDINKTIATIVSVDEFVENIEGIKNGNFNIISIRSSDGRMGQDKLRKYDLIDEAKFNNICIAIFDDLQKDGDRGTNQYIFPAEKHIFPILEWARNKWEENKYPFLIHCTAGISRSSATAIVINKMIRNNVKDAFDTKFHWPNMEILRLGEKFLGVNDIVSQVKEKMMLEKDGGIYGINF